MGLDTKAAFQPAVKLGINGLGIATGRDFPDGLTSVNNQVRWRAPLLLVSYNSANQKKQTDAAIKAVTTPNLKNLQVGYIYGGTTAVGTDIEATLKNLKTVPWTD